MVRKLKNVEPEPKVFCVTLKTKITDYLSVKARIGNQTTDQTFIFDTGAPLAYSFKTKDSFNIKAKKYYKIGSQKMDYGSGNINLGNVKFNQAGFIVLNDVLEYYKEVQGTIGSSLFQASACEINFADSTIKISNDLKNFTNIKDCYSTSFEPYSVQATPIVKIAIGKDTIKAFIDTGNPGFLSLNGDIKKPLESANKEESYRNVRYFGYSKKDLFYTWFDVQLPKFGIAGIELDSVIVEQDPKYYGKNLLGLEFLKKFIVTIDWINHRIYFKPIGTLNFKQSIYTYGFTCRIYNKELRVSQIYKGSEAEKAGLKSGDVIVSVNKKTDFSREVLLEINSDKQADKSIEIEIKAGATLTLKKCKLFN